MHPGDARDGGRDVEHGPAVGGDLRGHREGHAQVDAARLFVDGVQHIAAACAKAADDTVGTRAHGIDVEGGVRADEVTETDRRAAYQAVAPQTENGLYLVPKVIE